YKEGEELTVSRQYDAAIEKYQDAISREASFLEAYLKLTQLQITKGDFESAELTALAGKSRLSGKNATKKHHSDFGWVLTHVYLGQGRFQEAYDEFTATDPLFDDSFRELPNYLEMKEHMDFLA